MQTDGRNVLWKEDFNAFAAAPEYYWKGKDDKWVRNPEHLVTEPGKDGRLRLASKSPTGYAGMSHIFP